MAIGVARECFYTDFAYQSPLLPLGGLACTSSLMCWSAIGGFLSPSYPTCILTSYFQTTVAFANRWQFWQDILGVVIYRYTIHTSLVY